MKHQHRFNLFITLAVCGLLGGGGLLAYSVAALDTTAADRQAIIDSIAKYDKLAALKGLQAALADNADLKDEVLYYKLNYIRRAQNHRTCATTSNLDFYTNWSFCENLTDRYKVESLVATGDMTYPADIHSVVYPDGVIDDGVTSFKDATFNQIRSYGQTKGIDNSPAVLTAYQNYNNHKPTNLGGFDRIKEDAKEISTNLATLGKECREVPGENWWDSLAYNCDDSMPTDDASVNFFNAYGRSEDIITILDHQSGLVSGSTIPADAQFTANDYANAYVNLYLAAKAISPDFSVNLGEYGIQLDPAELDTLRATALEDIKPYDKLEALQALRSTIADDDLLAGYMLDFRLDFLTNVRSAKDCTDPSNQLDYYTAWSFCESRYERYKVELLVAAGEMTYPDDMHAIVYPDKTDGNGIPFSKMTVYNTAEYVRNNKGVDTAGNAHPALKAAYNNYYSYTSKNIGSADQIDSEQQRLVNQLTALGRDCTTKSAENWWDPPINVCHESTATYVSFFDAYGRGEDIMTIIANQPSKGSVDNDTNTEVAILALNDARASGTTDFANFELTDAEIARAYANLYAAAKNIRPNLTVDLSNVTRLPEQEDPNTPAGDPNTPADPNAPAVDENGNLLPSAPQTGVLDQFGSLLAANPLITVACVVILAAIPCSFLAIQHRRTYARKTRKYLS